MNQRNLSIDVLKGLAIILVVLGHCIQYGTSNTYLKEELFFTNEIFIIIYSFHMPLFMLISGYLFNRTVNKHTLKEIIQSRITTLLIPILMWSLILFISSVLTSKNIVNNIIFDKMIFVKVFFNIFLNELWFLWAIFYCSFIALIVKNNKLIYIFGFILTFFVPDILGTALYKYMYPFFVIGYFFATYEVRTKFLLNYKRINYLVLILFGTIFMYLLQFYQKNSYIYTSGYYIFGSSNPIWQIKIDLYRLTIGLTGSIFVMLLIRKIIIININFNRNICVIAIAYIGKNSLGIYIISNCFLNRILAKISRDVGTIDYKVTIIETILVIVISLCGCIAIKKISIINKLFLGGRDIKNKRIEF